MRVLLVAHQYWPTPGSATQVLSALVRDLTERGHSVDVLTCRPPAGIAEDTIGPHGERVHFVASAEKAGLGPLRALKLGEFVAGILRLGRKIEADVIVSDPPPTAGWAALTLARRSRVPFVYYMADSWVGASTDMSGFAGRLRGAIRAIESRVVLGADHVVAATHGMARIARSFGEPRVTVVENGADLTAYSPTGEQWQAPTEHPYFLYAGNAGAVHGASVFTEAANLLWAEGLEFDLVFMGHGADFATLVESADRPQRVHRVGTQPTMVVASAYRSAVGALSSLKPNPKYADARPIKTLTGLASGCPAVYAGEGDFSEVLRNERLGFVSGWNARGAADSIRAALALHASPDSELELRAHCARFAADHFDDRIAAAQVGDIIESSVKDSKS